MTKKIFIDPGHGGSDSGAVGVNNLLEKDINLDVAKIVASLLSQQKDVVVYLSREIDATTTLYSRTSTANNLGVDCFISIHCNAFNSTAQGLETYSYSESTNDLAGFIHNKILESGNYTKDRGLKTANFYVLKETTMRATLVELGFIDNTEDAKILVNKQYELALAISKGICEYLDIDFFIEVIDPNVFYRVVCGSFNSKISATQRINELESLGYDAFIDVYYKEDK